MKRGLIIAGICALVIILGIIYLYYRVIYSPAIGPCEGYGQVGDFQSPLNSEQVVRQTVVDFFSSKGYTIQPEYISVAKIENGWRASFSSEHSPSENYCSGSVNNPPGCIGQLLKFIESGKDKNKIMMRYGLPC